MAMADDDLIAAVTDTYLGEIDKANLPDTSTIKQELLDRTNMQFRMLAAAEGQKNIPFFRTLTPLHIAKVLVALHGVKNINMVGDTEVNEDGIYLMGVYRREGPGTGTYDTTASAVTDLILGYNGSISTTKVAETMLLLNKYAPKVTCCEDPDIIPVNNGLFNYRTKQLMPFDPNRVFISKSSVDYNPAATNITIHNDEDGTDWDFDSWMGTLSDDPEVVNLLLEIIGAAIRPIRWNKSAWLYATDGNNGKGTFCQLVRNLCGPGTWVSLSLSTLCKPFAMEKLIGKSAIIVDENNVGQFLEENENVKLIVTGDIINVDRKYKSAVSMRFRGFMIQCVNDMPRTRDRSGSFYRRQLFIPFNKCFTGAERPYIKNDYIQRPEVLEYVLQKVLNMTYYKLSEPAACKALLEEYKEINDPMQQFVHEMLPECKWDLLPNGFLYDLYKAWYVENVQPTGWLGKKGFLTQLRAVLKDSTEWTDCMDIQTRPEKRMSVPEPLIERYKLENWYGDMGSKDIKRRCVPKTIAAHYRGLIRNTKT